MLRGPNRSVLHLRLHQGSSHPPRSAVNEAGEKSSNPNMTEEYIFKINVFLCILWNIFFYFSALKSEKRFGCF